MQRVIFIGQAPARPGSRHAAAGTYLRPWLYQLGLDEAAIAGNCRFYALVGSFPGSTRHGHLRPTPAMVAGYRPVLMNLIADFNPGIVVPVGAMAIAEILPHARGTLGDIIGHRYHVDPFESLGKEITAVPLPHPSGRSTWLNANAAKVTAALSILQHELV